MTILQALLNKPADQRARLATPAPPGGRRTASTSTSFDNRPTWDNWQRR